MKCLQLEFFCFLACLSKDNYFHLGIHITHFCIISRSRDTLCEEHTGNVGNEEISKERLLSNRRCCKFLQVTMKLDLSKLRLLRKRQLLLKYDQSQSINTRVRNVIFLGGT